jgi:hypothetical protein|tara:strand:- start:255 stop:473 length:219 start_codon:yes stop_codon:yes gene_type:complete
MMKNLIRDIKRIDKKLLTKIQQGKMTENFGQSDVRKLRDKYDVYDSEIGSMIRDFDMYCATMNSSSKGFFNE